MARTSLSRPTNMGTQTGNLGERTSSLALACVLFRKKSKEETGRVDASSPGRKQWYSSLHLAARGEGACVSHRPLAWQPPRPPLADAFRPCGRKTFVLRQVLRRELSRQAITHDTHAHPSPFQQRNELQHSAHLSCVEEAKGVSLSFSLYIYSTSPFLARSE